PRSPTRSPVVPDTTLVRAEPGTQLPEGSSPKLTVPFAAARDFLSGRHLEIECRRDGDSGGATLVVSSDPVDLVAGARLLGPGGRSEEHTSELQSRENLVCR